MTIAPTLARFWLGVQTECSSIINVRNCGEKRGDIDYTNGLYGDADRQGPFPAYHIN